MPAGQSAGLKLLPYDRSPEFRARIVAVEDVYDALVTERRGYKDVGMFSSQIMEFFRTVRSESEKTVKEMC